MRGVGGWQRLGPSSPPHTRHEPLPHIEPCVFSPSPAQGKVIPDSVSWGGQSGGVFSAMSVDFMKPVVAKVDQLLQVCLRLRGEGRAGRAGRRGPSKREAAWHDLAAAGRPHQCDRRRGAARPHLPHGWCVRPHWGRSSHPS